MQKLIYLCKNYTISLSVLILGGLSDGCYSKIVYILPTTVLNYFFIKRFGIITTFDAATTHCDLNHTT